jgi:hypothetical protein
MCHCFLLLKHTEEKTHKKTTKRNQEKGGSLPSSSHPAFSLLAHAFALPLLHFRFKCFFLTASYSQVEDKKKHKEKKTIEKKKYANKGRSLPSNSRYTLSLLTPASTLSLLHFRFKCFLLASSSFQAEEKKT